MSLTPAINALQKLAPSILKRDDGTIQYMLWKPIADEVDELAAAVAQVRTILEIQTMTGVNLDRLGATMNQAREGWDDDDYRVHLQVAMLELTSRGDINSLNTIAEALGYENINIIEAPAGARLDGLSFLDGTAYLVGGDRPATFLFFQHLNVDDTTSTTDISESMNAARAAGITAQISFDYTSEESQGVDYTDYSGLLDGTVLLDGETALDPDKKDFTPDYIALGDGAVGEPGALDTTLVNEVLRKPVVTYYEDGVRYHSITVLQSELDGYTINEMAIFKGTSMMWADAFTGKLKDSLTIFIFKMQEDD